jgi:hypothetical protein
MKQVNDAGLALWGVALVMAFYLASVGVFAADYGSKGLAAKEARAMLTAQAASR